MKGEVRERERERASGGGLGHKRVRKVEGRLEGQVQHLPIGLCLVSCRTSKWVTVGLMLLLMVANGSMWVYVGLCGRVKVTVNLLV